MRGRNRIACQLSRFHWEVYSQSAPALKSGTREREISGTPYHLHANDLGGNNLGAASSKSRMLIIDPNVGFFSPGAPSGVLLLASSSTLGKGPETGPR